MSKRSKFVTEDGKLIVRHNWKQWRTQYFEDWRENPDLSNGIIATCKECKEEVKMTNDALTNGIRHLKRKHDIDISKSMINDEFSLSHQSDNNSFEIVLMDFPSDSSSVLSTPMAPVANNEPILSKNVSQELRRLFMQACLSYDFNSKVMESHSFHALCKLLVPDFKIPVITEEFEIIKPSIVSKFSDIQSLSVIADEWLINEIPFCILSCTAITKSYEHFKCFLGCKFNEKFSSGELVKKCKEVIPDFRSKLVRVLSVGDFDQKHLYHCNLFVLNPEAELMPKSSTEELNLIGELSDVNNPPSISNGLPPNETDSKDAALIEPYRRTCIVLELLKLLEEVMAFLNRLETIRRMCEAHKKEFSSWDRFEDFAREHKLEYGLEYKMNIKAIKEFSRLEFSAIRNLAYCNQHLQKVWELEKSFNAKEIYLNKKTNKGKSASELPGAPLLLWEMMAVRTILESDQITKCHDVKLTEREMQITNEFLSVVAPLQETIDEFMDNSEMIGCVIPSYLLTRSKLAEFSKDTVQFPHWKDLAGIIKFQLENRLGYVLKDVDCLLGAVLDPRFKLDWVASAGKVKSDVEEKVREELKKRLATTGTDPGNSSEESSTNDPPAKVRKLSRFSSILTSQKSNTKDNRVDLEFDVYTSEEVADDESLKPLRFWKENVKRFPTLASATTSLFGIPVTLGGPATMFQAFKDFYRFQSNGWSAEMVEKLMYLKHNAHLTN